MICENGNGKMEKKEETRVINGGVAVEEYWWWAAASAAQLGWGISIFRKGYGGDSHFMPFKAFSVASLFVGAAATAAVASLRSSGVHSVQDLKAVGTNIRSGLGVRPRTRNE
ncbi:hypothetical protein BUALT_Bualt19G0021800 [Buddleja alternifolia]|uniref:Uncharacterized protein n=1 Tax=Buddleja alternifolia TaxID=168488 RepID=A0AAV6W8Y9_9LAMI|nr:hypothetical protein BUALT_Bualt19G0021800 [Buddleja alternifolia]